MRFWITIVFILISDQLSKYWVAKEIMLHDSIPILENIFSITYVLNYGAAFGVLQGKSWLFLTIAALIVTVLIIIHIKYDLSRWVQYAMGLIVGGTLGNVIDRWFIGAVRDFFSIGGFPVFNIADMAIVCGGAIVILYIFKNDSMQERQFFNR